MRMGSARALNLSVAHMITPLRHHEDMVSSESSEPEAAESEPAQAKWFRTLGREIKEEYERLHRAAPQDPQRAGHGGEGTWVAVLREWLPQGYDIVTRKYVVPEVGSEQFETDIIVLNPSYPGPLRAREEVLAGGVAAAFGSAAVPSTAEPANSPPAILCRQHRPRASPRRSGPPDHRFAGQSQTNAS